MGLFPFDDRNCESFIFNFENRLLRMILLLGCDPTAKSVFV